MDFRTKKLNTQTLGEYLNACRQSLGLSVKEVSLVTQVQPKYIEALEAERFKDLPADVYVHGFLRALATHYHLDADRLLKQYKEESRISQRLNPSEKTKTGNGRVMPRFVLNPKTMTVAGVIFLGLAGLGYLYTQYRTLNQAPKLVIQSPAENGETDTGLLTVRGETETGAQLLINNQPVLVDAQGDFGVNLALAPGSNQIVFLARNKFGEETVTTRTMVYREKRIAGTFSTTTTTLRMEIVVEDEAAWVSVAADGREMFAGTMLPGAKRSVSAEERVTLTSGNAGVTRIILNGEDQGVLGENGEVVKDLEFSL